MPGSQITTSTSNKMLGHVGQSVAQRQRPKGQNQQKPKPRRRTPKVLGVKRRDSYTRVEDTRGWREGTLRGVDSIYKADTRIGG